MKIITTVGTSLFEKLGETSTTKSVREDKINYLDGYKKHKTTIVGRDGKGGLYQKIVSKDIFKKRNDSSICAEISSILKIVEDSDEESAEVHLLATDTVLSVLACELIKDWFKDNSNNIEVKFERPITEDDLKKSPFVIENLRISNNDNYEKGFMRLIEVLDSLKLKPTDVLNITGGYKAIIPILTIYGQLNDIPLKYIYDEQELGQTELIEVSGLPINFDWEIAQNVVQFLDNKLIKSNNPKNPKLYVENLTDDLCKKLYQLKLLTKDEKNGKYYTSFIAELLRKFVTEKSVVQKGVLGLFIEYKYYEFFNEPNLFGNYKASKPDFHFFAQKNTTDIYDVGELRELHNISPEIDDSRAVSEINKNLSTENQYDTVGDIDIKLMAKNGTVSLCEVKTYNTLGDFSSNKIKYRLESNCKAHPTEKIEEFIIMLYSVDFQFSISDKIPKKVSTKLHELKSELDKNIVFRVFVTKIILTEDSLKVNYDKLLKKKIDVEEIKLN